MNKIISEAKLSMKLKEVELNIKLLNLLKGKVSSSGIAVENNGVLNVAGGTISGTNYGVDNKENATASSLNQGQGDDMNVRVWWDTQRYK